MILNHQAMEEVLMNVGYILNLEEHSKNMAYGNSGYGYQLMMAQWQQPAQHKMPLVLMYLALLGLALLSVLCALPFVYFLVEHLAVYVASPYIVCSSLHYT